MHFLTLPLLLLTAHLSTALVLHPRSTNDGATDGCHPSDYVTQCPSSQDADAVTNQCKGWCWPAIDGGPEAGLTKFDPMYCGKCLDKFIVRGGPNAPQAAATCASFMTGCGVKSMYSTVEGASGPYGAYGGP